MVTLQDIQDASKRLAPYIVRTPLLRVPALDEQLNCQVYLKFEGFQVMGAFKIRGAMNKALSLSAEDLKKGLVCASSGNHAQGVACAAKRLGTRSVIVMPVTANPVKLAGVKAFGGEVELVGTLSSEREARVRELAEQEGMINVHPYADPYVIAGQGTMGLEIMEDLPDVDAVVVPIGGGGMISGIATAVKSLKPSVRTIGAEPAGAPRYSLSRAAGSPQALEKVDTIADGTRTDKANPGNFETIQKYVDELCTAEDSAIRQAMRLLMTKGKITPEPSGALPVAAALSRAFTADPTQKVVFVLSGGNVDPALAAEILGA